MRKAKILNIIGIIVILMSIVLPAMAQKPGVLKISYMQPETIVENENTQGIIQCRVKKGVLAKNEPGAKLVVYAQNDLRNVPMTLMLNDKALKVKSGVNNIVFSAPYSDMFFTEKSEKGYSWKWRARGRAPMSPIAPIAKKQVSKVQVWAALYHNSEVYISDTITIDVQ